MNAAPLVIYIFLIALADIVNAASGGNCENICKATLIEPPLYENCLAEHKCAESDDCNEECQECFVDVYSACGGCTNKYGFDFDQNLAPAVRERAESMGCSSAELVEPRTTGSTLITTLCLVVMLRLLH